MISSTEKQTMLDNLKRAKYSGRRSITLADGSNVSFGNVAELQRAIDDLTDEINTDNSVSQSRTSFSSFCRG